MLTITTRASLICIATSLVLGGCALARLGPAEAPRTYDLVSLGGSSEVSRTARARGVQLVINEPVALRALSSDRIAVRPSASEIEYFGKAAWADQLPRIVQARMIESFERSGRFAAVASNRQRLDADVAISTDIRAFQIERANDTPIAHVDLYVRLMDQRRARVIAQKGFRDQTHASGDDALAGVEALNASMQNILPRVAAWAGRVRMPRRPEPRRLPRPLPRVTDPEPPDDVTPELRDTQTDERETDPNARPPISPDLLIGRRRRNTGRL